LVDEFHKVTNPVKLPVNTEVTACWQLQKWSPEKKQYLPCPGSELNANGQAGFVVLPSAASPYTGPQYRIVHWYYPDGREGPGRELV